MNPSPPRLLLYRIYSDDGTLLYVGATVNPGVRFSEHASHTPWWDEASEIKLQRCESVEALKAAEIEAIKAENPRYNRMHSKPPPFKRRRPRGQGTLTQRPDGYWYASINVPGGKPKTFYGWTREIVEKKLADFKAELAVRP